MVARGSIPRETYKKAARDERQTFIITQSSDYYNHQIINNINNSNNNKMYINVELGFETMLIKKTFKP